MAKTLEAAQSGASMPAPHCPRCRSRMEQGFVLDETYGALKNSGWVRGVAERSIWTGVKLRGRKPSPIITYRCERCGLLESYVPTLHARA